MQLFKFYLAIFFFFILYEFKSGERLFHVLIPWSNIVFLAISNLKKRALANKLLPVSYE